MNSYMLLILLAYDRRHRRVVRASGLAQHVIIIRKGSTFVERFDYRVIDRASDALLHLEAALPQAASCTVDITLQGMLRYLSTMPNRIHGQIHMVPMCLEGAINASLQIPIFFCILAISAAQQLLQGQVLARIYIKCNFSWRLFRRHIVQNVFTDSQVIFLVSIDQTRAIQVSPQRFDQSTARDFGNPFLFILSDIFLRVFLYDYPSTFSTLWLCWRKL